MTDLLPGLGGPTSRDSIGAGGSCRTERGTASRPDEAFVIDDATLSAVLDHLTAALPNEGVGLLAVESGPGLRAVRFYPGTNVDASPTRYTMDPEEVLRAFADIEARGWRFGAVVHSHPRTPPTPSETDLREAHYPEAALVIVGFSRHPPLVRAWRVTPFGGGAGAVAALRLVVETTSQGPTAPGPRPWRAADE